MKTKRNGINVSLEFGIPLYDDNSGRLTLVSSWVEGAWVEGEEDRTFPGVRLTSDSDSISIPAGDLRQVIRCLEVLAQDLEDNGFKV